MVATKTTIDLCSTIGYFHLYTYSWFFMHRLKLMWKLTSELLVSSQCIAP